MRFNENDIISCDNCAKDCDYTKVAMVSCLVSNDFKHIHLHAGGEQFDRIHDIAQEYYERSSEELDYLCELSLEYLRDLPNLSLAGSILSSEYTIETGISYDYDSAIDKMSKIISSYLLYLHNLNDCTTDNSIKSYLDEEIRYWQKELNYKLVRRSASDEDISDMIISVPIDDEMTNEYEATQAGAIGQHKNTGTTSYPPIDKKKRKRKPPWKNG